MNNNIEPTSLGWGSEPGAQKKNTWIWIVVAVLVLCLCLAAVGVGLYYFFSIRSSQVSTQVPGGGIYPSEPTRPLIATQYPTPSEAVFPPSTVVVETYYPGDYYDYSILELNSLYDWSSTPGVMTWDVSINSSDSVILEQGWCTISQETLDQNFEHIQLTFEVDNEVIDLATFYEYDWMDDDLYCRSYLGIVQAWPVGDHVVVIELRLDDAISDGWEEYEAGQYIDQFIIYVSP